MVVGLMFFASSEVMASPPNNLLVLVDHEYSTYISPECISSDVDYESDNFEIVSFEKATDDFQYEYDSTCTYDSLWPSRNNLWDFIGTKIGFLEPINSKWNDDGTWNEEVFQ